MAIPIGDRKFERKGDTKREEERQKQEQQQQRQSLPSLGPPPPSAPPTFGGGGGGGRDDDRDRDDRPRGRQGAGGRGGPGFQAQGRDRDRDREPRSSERRPGAVGPDRMRPPAPTRSPRRAGTPEAATQDADYYRAVYESMSGGGTRGGVENVINRLGAGNPRNPQEFARQGAQEERAARTRGYAQDAETTGIAGPRGRGGGTGVGRGAYEPGYTAYSGMPATGSSATARANTAATADYNSMADMPSQAPAAPAAGATPTPGAAQTPTEVAAAAGAAATPEGQQPGAGAGGYDGGSPLPPPGTPGYSGVVPRGGPLDVSPSDIDWNELGLDQATGERWAMQFAQEHGGNFPWNEGTMDPENNLLEHIAAMQWGGKFQEMSGRAPTPYDYGNKWYTDRFGLGPNYYIKGASRGGGMGFVPWGPNGVLEPAVRAMRNSGSGGRRGGGGGGNNRYQSRPGGGV